MITKLLKSRQFWTLVALFIVNGITGIQDSIPASFLPYINSILGIMTIYFRVSPKQQF